MGPSQLRVKSIFQNLSSFANLLLANSALVDSFLDPRKRTRKITEQRLGTNKNLNIQKLKKKRIWVFR